MLTQVCCHLFLSSSTYWTLNCKEISVIVVEYFHRFISKIEYYAWLLVASKWMFITELFNDSGNERSPTWRVFLISETGDVTQWLAAVYKAQDLTPITK